jgi:hypothetical protein
MWVVGTDSGDFDWQPIDAPSREAAISSYAVQEGKIKCDRWARCEPGPCALPCEWCDAEARQDEPRGNIGADRVEAWDRLTKVTPAAFIRAGYGAFCEWCGYETFPEEGGAIVYGKATCEGCRERKPWRARPSPDTTERP